MQTNAPGSAHLVYLVSGAKLCEVPAMALVLRASIMNFVHSGFRRLKISNVKENSLKPTGGVSSKNAYNFFQ